MCVRCAQSPGNHRGLPLHCHYFDKARGFRVGVGSAKDGFVQSLVANPVPTRLRSVLILEYRVITLAEGPASLRLNRPAENAQH